MTLKTHGNSLSGQPHWDPFHFPLECAELVEILASPCHVFISWERQESKLQEMDLLAVSRDKITLWLLYSDFLPILAVRGPAQPQTQSCKTV